MKSTAMLRSASLLLAGALCAMPSATPARSWKPERPVEIMVGCSLGCGLDVVARMM